MKQRQYSLIANSYAEALYRAARAKGQTQRLFEESRTLAKTIINQPQFIVFLQSPQIANQPKHDLIEKVFGSFSPILLRLLGMLVQRERVGQLTQILERFEELVEQAEGIYPATLSSAVDLGYQEQMALRAVLEKYTGFRLNIHFVVEPRLIGGLIFRCRDLLIDSSLHNALENLRRGLASTTINNTGA